jgi:tetratricopeptide (TPR) repeat protein
MGSRNSTTVGMLAIAWGAFAAVTLIAAHARAQEASPEVQQAHRRLVEYQTKEARAALQPVAARADTDGAVAVTLGRIQEQEKKYNEAAKTLAKAADLLPGDPAPQVYLGETYVHAKRYAEAEKAFGMAAQLAQVAVEKDEHNAAAWYYLGLAQLRMKQYDKAFSSLAKAKNAGFESALVLFQQGATRVWQGNWQEAVDLLTRAINENSGLAYAYYYRGLAQDKLGKKDQLVLDMDRFLKVAPQAPEADKAQAVLKAAKR